MDRIFRHFRKGATMRKILVYYGIVLMALLTIISMTNVLPYSLREDRTEDERRVEEKPQKRLLVNENDLDLLARAVHAESRGEPYDGQIAVAAVIINRVESEEFPNTIPGVIYEPLAFSVVADGQINRPAGEEALRAAHDALNGIDPSNGALFFYNPAKARSAWLGARPVLKTIGKHVFLS